MFRQNISSEFWKWKVQLQMADRSMRGMISAGRVDPGALLHLFKKPERKGKGAGDAVVGMPDQAATEKNRSAGRDEAEADPGHGLPGAQPEGELSAGNPRCRLWEEDMGDGFREPARYCSGDMLTTGGEMTASRQDRLKQAMVWSVVLGDPVCRRRRTGQRMERHRYGSR